MRYAERNDDVLRYQGHQYTWIGWDELTQWPTLFCYHYMKSRLRSAHNVPTKRIRSAANPGGPGHNEVKAYFIDPSPNGFELVTDPETGIERMFVPARLRDNAILVQNDPDYDKRLKGSGSAALVKALLDGDWNVIDGAFFDCWSQHRHVIQPMSLPRDWLRFRSMDWGSASPFSIGWWSVVADDTYATNFAGKRILMPRGAIVRYREWYGAEKGKGLKLSNEAIGRGILEREAGENVSYGVLDPACFAEDGGPSIAEQISRTGVYFTRADNKRVSSVGAIGGWSEMRGRLIGIDEGKGPAMIFCFSTCVDSIRTIPVLQHDPRHAEDLDTTAEDHAADEWRYACMSRPWIQAAPKKDADEADRGYAEYGEDDSPMEMMV